MLKSASKKPFNVLHFLLFIAGLHDFCASTVKSSSFAQGKNLPFSIQEGIVAGCILLVLLLIGLWYLCRGSDFRKTTEAGIMTICVKKVETSISLPEQRFQVCVVYDAVVLKTSLESETSWDESLQTMTEPNVRFAIFELWGEDDKGQRTLIGEGKMSAKKMVRKGDVKIKISDMWKEVGTLFASVSLHDLEDIEAQCIVPGGIIAPGPQLMPAPAPPSPTQKKRWGFMMDDDEEEEETLDVAVSTLHDLAKACCGPLKKDEWLMEYYAVYKDVNVEGPSSGWYWGRWETMEAKQSGIEPRRRMPLKNLACICPSHQQAEFCMNWASKSQKRASFIKKESLELTKRSSIMISVDRSPQDWIESFRAFNQKLMQVSQMLGDDQVWLLRQASEDLDARESFQEVAKRVSTTISSAIRRSLIVSFPENSGNRLSIGSRGSTDKVTSMETIEACRSLTRRSACDPVA